MSLSISARILDFSRLVKFEHTVFALPFALASAVTAADGMPPWNVSLWILLAMVGARTAAMAFNRIVDAEYDRRNPRTANREIPAGKVSFAEACGLTAIGAAALVFAANRLNALAFALSPVALAVIFGYSYTKRFTSLSHLVLGLALGIAPAGAWIAVKGTLSSAPIALAAAVMTWTAGFDILYSLQDTDFDRREGLFSIPAKFGITKALLISRLLHVVMVILLCAFGLLANTGFIYFAGVLFVAVFLIREHQMVRPDNFSKINAAFFLMNGYVSIGFLFFTFLSITVRKLWI